MSAYNKICLYFFLWCSRYADGPRYYTEPKLLSFTLNPYSSPAVTAGLANAPDYAPADQLSLHIASLQYQLQQFYAAAAVATALGRVLIMPQMQCFCYRDPDSGPAGPASWLLGSSSSSEQQQQQQQWSCRAPGDDATSFPFNCSLDQVFSPQQMYRHSAVFAGRPLNFREASFLSNRRTPSWLRHAATRISSGSPVGCDGSDDGDSSSSSTGLLGGKCAQALPGKPPEGGNQQVRWHCAFCSPEACINLLFVMRWCNTAPLLYAIAVVSVCVVDWWQQPLSTGGWQLKSWQPSPCHRTAAI